MEKKIIVSKNDFQKHFITPIDRFLDKGEFACITYEDNNLVFNKAVNKDGLRFFYSNKLRPNNCDLDDGQQFFLMNVGKLKKILSIIKEEEVTLTVTNSHLYVSTNESRHGLKLHDSSLASTIHKVNSKVTEVLENLSDTFTIDKETTKRIKNSLLLIDEKSSVKILNKEGNLILVCGEKTDDQYKTKIGFCKDFTDAEITQGVFRSVGEADLEVYHNSMQDRPVLTFIEKLDKVERTYITTFV